MKQFLLFALCLFTVGLTAQTVIYVDADATGSGDGTSWENAYNNLHPALDGAPEGAFILVAEGMYRADSTFVIDQELTLLGGFDGTETSTDQADPANNLTILSGDVMGNDTADVFSLDFLSDNQQVLFVRDTATRGTGPSFICRVDGFTISSGASVVDSSTPFDTITDGGGMRVTGRTIATRLNFVNNRSRNGSAVTMFGQNVNGSVFQDIEVARNFTNGSNLSAFSLRSVANVRVSRVNFSGSAEGAVDDVGVMSVLFSRNVLVEDCSFAGINTNDFGSAVFARDNGPGIKFDNCSFTDIISTGGAVYLRNFDGRNTTTFEDCTFTNCDGNDGANATSGGLNSAGAEFRLFNTNFSGCDANVRGIGGAIQFRSLASIGNGDDSLALYRLLIDGCEFTENTTMRDGGLGGGAIGILGFDDAECELDIHNCEFTSNAMTGLAGDGRGGAINSIHFGNILQRMNISNTTFDRNSAFVGGAIYMTDVLDLNVEKSTFSSNTATFGGGVLVFTDAATEETRFDSCVFTNNSSAISAGAIYHGGPGGTDEAAPVVLNGCNFATNVAGTGESAGAGGAFTSFGGMDLLVTDCEFVSNSAGAPTSSGGALAVFRGESRRDTIDGVESIEFEGFRARAERTLFLGNTAIAQGGAINTGSAVMDLVNNIFVFNNIIVPAGDPETRSVSGGAVIFNGNVASPVRDDMDNIIGFTRAGSLPLEADIIHNTFAENTKGSNVLAVGNQLALFQPGETVFNEGNSMTLNMLNNAFILTGAVEDGLDQVAFEPGTTFEDDLQGIGEININSLGGNFFNITPDSLEFMLTDQDIVSTEIDDVEDVLNDPFEDDDDSDNDFELLDDDSNPLVGGGVANALVPEGDFFNNERDQDNPDIGAVSMSTTMVEVDPVSTNSIDESGLDMEFFPNPTVNVVNIRNNEASISSYYAVISDANGRVLQTRKVSEATTTFDLSDYATGVYNLMLIIDGKLYGKQLLRQ